MQPDPKAYDHSEAVLEAVCLVGSNTWCFLPIGTDTISHCSWSFRQLWNLPFDVEVPITLSNCAVDNAFRKHGLSSDWIRSLAKLENGRLPDAPYLPDLSSLGVKIKLRTVSDTEMQPIGRMLIFEHFKVAVISEDLKERTKQAQEMLAKLTERETEILDLVYEGFTNKAIGIRSEISEKTVEKHRSNIMQKLGIRNAASLVRCVTEAKLFSNLVTDNEDLRQQL